MPCYYPLAGWYAKAPNPETGKTPVLFTPNGADPERTINLPCGKCIGCRADQSLMWSVRCYHESTLHDKTSFITLTYADENLPVDGKLDKTHLQNFFKRIRKNYPPQSLRYFACGEYGDKTNRPHYHAILFGENFVSDKIDISKDLYTSPSLQKYWKFGNVSIAPVTMASICYVCGYVTKKMDDPDSFNLMSRRPGIGHDWFTRYHDDLARTGMVTIEGREWPIPKRYFDWDESASLDHLPEIRQQKAIENAKDGNQLRNLEKNRNSKWSQRNRKL